MKSLQHIWIVSLIALLVSGPVLWSAQEWFVLEKPLETTVFIDQPGNQPVTRSSDDIYYSQRDITFDMDAAIDAIKKLEKWVDLIGKQILELDGQYTDSDTRYAQTREEVIAVIRDIQRTKTVIENSLKKIRFYQEAITQWALAIDQLRTDIQSMKDHIARFTEFMYKLNNELYDTDGDIDNIKLFVKSDEHITDKLSNSYLVETMIMNLDELIQELQQEEKNQIKRIKEFNKFKIQASKEIKTYEQQVENLHQKRRYLTDFLDLYKDNKDKIERQLKNLFDTRKDVQSQIDATIASINDERYTASFAMSKKLEELYALQPYSDVVPANDIGRPLLPVERLGKHFKDAAYKDSYGVEHRWVELNSPQLSPVYAPRDGIVYTIVNRDGISLNWMLIVHTDGYISVYKYMNSFVINEWDIIRRGQLIGFSGGEPGTRGAGFISRWPNLTFAINQNGDYLDPLSLLDLSIVQNKEVLPEKYHIKYLQDLYQRPRELYKIDFMKGDSVLQRRSNFLDLYGVWIYREPAFRADAAEGTNIDIDVGICIWFAESTLGKYLTTSNNIGNVWNNDRWDRIPLWSALGGARAIYNTLNNIYLGQYNTILELSGYGNKKGKIYASSQFNRQNNVIKCLSMIKGYHVPDDFPFRNAPNPNIATSFDSEEKVPDLTPEG